MPPINESRNTMTVKQQNFLQQEDVEDDFDPRFSNQSDPRSSMHQYNKEYRGTYTNDAFSSNQKNSMRPGNGDYGRQAYPTTSTTTNSRPNQNLGPLFDCSQGRPLQLVSANPKTGEFKLNFDAFEVDLVPPEPI